MSLSERFRPKNISRKKILALCILVFLCVTAYRIVEQGLLQDFCSWRRRLHYEQTGIVKAQGVEFCLPPGDWFTNQLIESGVWEPLETALLRRELRKGDVFVDVGAHFGYFTLIAAQIVGDEGQVIAFEPDPNNFAVLKKNVEHNGFRNVVLENLAASNVAGSIRLFLTGSHMEHSVVDTGQRTEAVDVQCVRLDDYFSGPSREPDVIKIDTEGAEGLILQGMQGILRENKKVRLVIEYSPRLLAASGHEPEQLLGTLRSFGFEIQVFDDATKAIVALPPQETTRLTERLKAESTFANIFARRRETN